LPLLSVSSVSSPPSSDHHHHHRRRRLALKKHPDKNPDNPNAAAEFAELQKAYALLCDDEARGALDAWIDVERQKQERGKKRSEKRQKMAEDLEMRERRDRDGAQAREAEIKLKLQRQLDRLKRQAEERQWIASQRRRDDLRREGSEDRDHRDPQEEADDAGYLRAGLEQGSARLFPAGASIPARKTTSVGDPDPRDRELRDAEARVLEAMMGRPSHAAKSDRV
jgi:curved DNA-binding protein CbpA